MWPTRQLPSLLGAELRGVPACARKGPKGSNALTDWSSPLMLLAPIPTPSGGEDCGLEESGPPAARPCLPRRPSLPACLAAPAVCVYVPGKGGARRPPRRYFPCATLEEAKEVGKMPNRQQWERWKQRGLQGAVSQLWLVGDPGQQSRVSHQRRQAEGQPQGALGPAGLASKASLLTWGDSRCHNVLPEAELSEIFPGLTSSEGPGGKQLGSRVPPKDGGVERKRVCDGALHTEHRMNVCVQGDCHHPLGDATHSEDPRQPGRLGRTARQSLHRRPGRAGGQAGSLPGGGTRCELLNMTNPPRGTGPGL